MSQFSKLPEAQEKFREQFVLVCQDYLENYCNDDPENPRNLTWSRNFDLHMLDRMPEEYQTTVAYLKRYPAPTHVSSLYTEVMFVLTCVTEYMKAYFKIYGYDYDNIPKPPDVEHMKKVRVKGGVTFGGHHYPTAYQFGQVIWVGSSSHTRGYAKLYRTDGVLIFSTYPQTNGVGVWNVAATEEAWRLAGEVSKVADLNTIGKNPAKVDRAIRENLGEVIQSSFLKDLIRWN